MLSHDGGRVVISVTVDMSGLVTAVHTHVEYPVVVSFGRAADLELSEVTLPAGDDSRALPPSRRFTHATVEDYRVSVAVA